MAGRQGLPVKLVNKLETKMSGGLTIVWDLTESVDENNVSHLNWTPTPVRTQFNGQNGNGLPNGNHTNGVPEDMASSHSASAEHNNNSVKVGASTTSRAARMVDIGTHESTTRSVGANGSTEDTESSNGRSNVFENKSRIGVNGNASKRPRVYKSSIEIPEVDEKANGSVGVTGINGVGTNTIKRPRVTRCASEIAELNGNNSKHSMVTRSASQSQIHEVKGRADGISGVAANTVKRSSVITCESEMSELTGNVSKRPASEIPELTGNVSKRPASEIPELTGNVSKRPASEIPELTGNVSEIPELTGNVSEIPELTGNVSKRPASEIPELTGNVSDIPELTGNVSEIPELTGNDNERERLPRSASRIHEVNGSANGPGVTGCSGVTMNANNRVTRSMTKISKVHENTDGISGVVANPSGNLKANESGTVKKSKNGGRKRAEGRPLHVCLLCNMEFPLIYELKRHSMVHIGLNGETLHHCPECNTPYSCKTTLTKHQIRVHNMTPPRKRK